MSANFKLVVRVVANARKKQFPNTGTKQLPHRMNSAIPIVEITNYADPLRIRRPYREINTAFAIQRPQMRAELVVDAPVRSFGKQMQIGLAHDRPISVRVACSPFRSRVRREMQPIIQVASSSGQLRAEETVAMKFLGFDAGRIIAVGHDRNLPGIGTENADRQIIAHSMRTEDAKWVGV